MPHATESEFGLIEVRELHPTFGAEVLGVDFAKPVPEDVFAEIYKAISNVSTVPPLPPSYLRPTSPLPIAPTIFLLRLPIQA